MVTRLMRLGMASLFAVPLFAQPAAAAGTTVSIGSATVGGSTITVGGTLALASDATTVVVGTDGAGDTSVAAPGLDLGDATITTQLSSSRLVFSVALRNANAALDGPPPATGIGWPISVNDQQNLSPWLGAGTAGTNFPPRTADWGALCRIDGGWICDSALTTTITTTAVTWTVPFNRTSPAITPGSVVGPGSAYAASIATFSWPSALVLFQLAPYDTMNTLDAMLVPGKVEVGIAPAGVPESAVEFAAAVNANGTTGAFSTVVPKPASAGDYTLWARSCFGLSDTPTCVSASHNVTI